MKKYLKNFVSDYEKELNVSLMNSEDDRPLVEYVMESWKSLEVLSTIKITGYDYTEEESKINVNKLIFKREKKKKKKDRYDYKFINDSRVGQLTVYMNVSLVETDPETGKPFIHTYPMHKSMLIPLQDEDGCFQIKGSSFFLIYQLVEKSTYTSNGALTLKSLMPVKLKRGVIEKDEVLTSESHDLLLSSVDSIDAYDVVGKTYTMPMYFIYVLKKEIPFMLFYLSRGAKFALDFLGVSNVISFIDKLPKKHEEDTLYFQLSSRCYIKVIKSLFLKYPYIQAIVGGFCYVTTNRVTLEQLEDPKVWIKKLVIPNNYEKGKTILQFFNRLMDESTKKILKVHKYHLGNIYTVIRWMMQEFNELRLKDNLDLTNKRLRKNEYVASLLTLAFSDRLKRIVSLGDKATIDNYRELLKFPGDILLQKMNQSGILRFNDTVNDMTFFNKFKYTRFTGAPFMVKHFSNCGKPYMCYITKLVTVAKGNSLGIVTRCNIRGNRRSEIRLC